MSKLKTHNFYFKERNKMLLSNILFLSLKCLKKDKLKVYKTSFKNILNLNSTANKSLFQGHKLESKWEVSIF